MLPRLAGEPGDVLDGKVRQAYYGSCLDWLSDEQSAHFLKYGLVERIPDAEQAAIAADAPVEPVNLEADEDEDAPAAEESGAVDECLATLAHLQVPATAGAPTARTALRDAGYRFGNDVIAHAVRRRKSALSEATAEDEDAFESIEL